MTVYVKPDDPAGESLPRLRVLLSALEGTAGNKYSQFGEDGLIEAIFGIIGITNRWCFEVGASDGVFYSNTKALRDDGWSAVLIENNWVKHRQLRAFESTKVRTIRTTIDGDMALDRVLIATGAPRDLDFGVIDIDGHDYWAWTDMRQHVPRVMLVEYSPYPKRRCAEDGSVERMPEDFYPERDGSGQAGLEAISRLGDEKGYQLAATTSVNALFVKKELLPA